MNKFTDDNNYYRQTDDTQAPDFRRVSRGNDHIFR